MPTTIFRLVLVLVLIFVLSPVTANRRILHQPFFPQTSTPPPAPPAPPALPFSGSTPDQDPFFPSYPPPPPSPTPLPPSPFVSFPANISSLPLPHSPSSHPLSKKLVAVTVCVSISAVVIASVALFFYFRGLKTRPTDIPTPKAAAAAASAAAAAPAPPAPSVRNSGRSNSTEFLYLGTLANSTSSISSAGVGGVARVPGGGRGSSRPRPKRTDSPELHPLPPLTRRQIGGTDDDQEQFYSPRGSVSGRESGSDSRRVFASVTQTADTNGGNCDDTTSYSSSSGSDSPSRSVSISISPPISASPKNRSTISNPKSSPEFIELNLQPTSSPPYLPESDTSSESEKAVEAVEVEAEESPLLSHASSSSRMNSPPQSPILSPIAGKIGQFSPEKSDWNDLNRSSPVSNSSSWSRKSSFLSLNLPAFLGGGKRKSSPENSPTSPISSLGSSLNAPLPRPPPPPPPPPPTFRRSQSPPLPPPVAPLVSKRDGIATPLKHVLVEKQVAESRAESSRSGESEETTPRPKLKPLHWDKVKASSDREMVWDQLRSSSFKLNEEMIETLFIVNNPTPSKKETPRGLISPMSKQENRVLDPKKAQNIAILLRALHVTMEEVCEALMEGNAETLGTELLESLLKMAPTKEEERKLKEYKDDSPVKLGHAEKFLKAVIDIPFAFKRVEAMLYIANFESEVEYLKKSFNTIEAACDELRSSRMFLKLLEAVLKTGNRMNVGTNRGDAHAFKLDTLLKLVDVKGADGKTTLLHFVVQEIIRTEGQRLSPSNNQSLTDEAKCRKLGLQVVSSLSSELANVKKAAAMDSDVLSNDVSKLSSGLGNIEQVLRLIGEVHSQENNRRFSESMNKFMKMAEEDIFRIQALERVALSLVKEITEYFHGNSAMEEAHPFRIFMVVRDLLTVLDRVCKEVGMINERTTVSSAHRFPVPINPMLPVPVNPFHHQVLPGFPGHRQSSFSDDGSL